MRESVSPNISFVAQTRGWAKRKLFLLFDEYLLDVRALHLAGYIGEKTR